VLDFEEDPVLHRLLADIVLVAHLAFILFVLGGGLFAIRWKRAMRLHLPAVAWGVAIELFGWICPLTHLENHLRALAGESGYQTTFVEQYLLPIVYPEALTRRVQLLLAFAVLGVNALIYAAVLRRSAGS
jgi:hypothetical protein